MKKILYIMLIVDILSTAIGFIALLPYSILLAILFLVLGIIGLVPLLALIRCLEDIEDLYGEINYLYGKVRKLEDRAGEPEKDEHNDVTARYEHTSKMTWKCVKCGTVNKAGSNHCENCNCEFSPDINPTYENNPKAVSRWVKPKKNKN